jgi:hypothetical protein
LIPSAMFSTAMILGAMIRDGMFPGVMTPVAMIPIAGIPAVMIPIAMSAVAGGVSATWRDRRKSSVSVGVILPAQPWPVRGLDRFECRSIFAAALDSAGTSAHVPPHKGTFSDSSRRFRRPPFRMRPYELLLVI